MKKDNKGFSLVELIIVIAIMAILVGIVGSQVLPYLNKSREAKDQQILSGWVTAALSAYSANAAVCTDTSYTVTIGVTTGTAGSASVTGGATAANSALQNSFNELAACSGTSFASNLYKSITSVGILVTPAPSDGLVVKVTSLVGPTAGSIATAELVAK